jgi:hypothetical protein
MITQYMIVGILIAIAAISKAIQDKIQFHFDRSIFKNLGVFWNPSESWKRKYKNNDPIQGPAFLGSTTIFVSLTDAWHLFGLVRNFSLVLSIAVVSANYWVLLYYILFIFTFHMFFTYFFERK